MKIKKYFIFLLAPLWLTFGKPYAATVAMETVDLGQLDNGRPAKINLWYPKGSCAKQTSRLCLAESAIVHKVVVFSHGTMGSAAEYDWLEAGLAEAGFIVVGVNHYGESRIYGEETQDPRSSILIWQRPQDISALLDRLATEPLFEKSVNWQNVIAIGHSAGGNTVALLAGARFDAKMLREYCDSDRSQADRSCNYGRNRPAAPSQFLEKFNGVYQDARIRKIVLLDPALGIALQPESLSHVQLPALVVGALHNDFLPWQNHGQRYVSAIPQARSILLEGQEGHFIFLSPCNHSVRVMDVALCEDAAGVDRKMVQENLLRQITEFTTLDNEPTAVVQQQVERYSTTSSLVGQILLYTPHWVFGVLVGLCILGLLQVRRRKVSVYLALALPMGMLMWSLLSTFINASLQITALFFWVAGIVTTTALCLKTMNQDIASLDSTTDKLLIKGSWLPLIMILGIFFTRFAFAIAQGMQFAITQTWCFPWIVSLISGAWSGFFLTRGLIFWRIANQKTLKL